MISIVYFTKKMLLWKVSEYIAPFIYKSKLWNIKMIWYSFNEYEESYIRRKIRKATITYRNTAKKENLGRRKRLYIKHIEQEYFQN